MPNILIKNMFMPTDDVLCIEIYPDGQVRRIVGWAISEKRDSTAVEVPPHGRLVDADKFIDLIKHEYSHDFICENDVELMLSLLKDEAPTVLEASE